MDGTNVAAPRPSVPSSHLQSLRVSLDWIPRHSVVLANLQRQARTQGALCIELVLPTSQPSAPPPLAATGGSQGGADAMDAMDAMPRCKGDREGDRENKGEKKDKGDEDEGDEGDEGKTRGGVEGFEMRLEIRASEDADAKAGEDAEKTTEPMATGGWLDPPCPVVLCTADRSALRVATHLGTLLCTRPVIQLERAAPGTRIDLCWHPASQWTARTRVAPGGTLVYRRW